MRAATWIAAIALPVVAIFAGAACRSLPTEISLERPTAGAAIADNACWGQASKVFARMGEMGEHASQEETPREGLRNLARYLYEMGVIPDDSMQALGQYVASAYGLSIEACQ